MGPDSDADARSTVPAPEPAGPGALAVTALFGLAAAGSALFLSNLALRRGVALVAALGLIFLGLVSRRPRPILLFCWTVTLTYNRNYFFEVFRAAGSYGPYWSPADAFLVALLGYWLWEVVVRKRSRVPVGNRVWPWLLPFVVVAALSGIRAEHPEWSGYELIRVLRIVLIVWYFRFNVRGPEWWACVAGLATAVILQTGLGVIYALTGNRLGLAFVLGADEDETLKIMRRLLEGVTDSDFGWRAEGTFGHPNTMAMYLLLVTPLFLSLATAPISRRHRGICAAVGIVALAGIGVTQSRTAWALALAQAGALAFGLAGRGLIRANRALGVACFSGFLAILVLLPLSGRIERRIRENLRDEVDFRAKHDRIALEIWQSVPFLGVGPNNYSDRLATRGEPEVDTFLSFEEAMRTRLELRITAWVHNIYLLMLAETGAIGLAALFFFFLGAVVMAVRGIRVRSPVWAAASLGLLIGMLGVHGHGTQEAAFWIDPVTYSFALVIGMLNNVPAIARQEIDGASIESARRVPHHGVAASGAC